MNIGLFTDTYYPEINGVATSVYQLKKELEKKGHQVYVFTVSNPAVVENETHIFRMKSIPFPLFKERRVGLLSGNKWFQTIQSLNLDIIHTQTEFVIGHMGRLAAQKFHISHIHTYHTIYEDYTHYLKVPGNEKLKGIVRLFSKHCCERADYVVAPTDKVRSLLLGYGVKKSIHVQPTGIDLSKFGHVSLNELEKLRNRFGITKETHVLLSIGRLSKEKNVREIIEQIPQLIQKDKHIKMLIVGDGPERENLQAYVSESNLSEYIIFVGEVPWKKIQNYYALGDIFVNASTSETQGLTYIEALAAGIPLLVKQDDCLKDVLQQGVNGYAFTNSEDFRHFYFELIETVSAPYFWRTVKQSASFCSSQAFGKNMEQIYNSVIQQNSTLHLEELVKYEKVRSTVG
ncbi:MAG: glycosyltransferase family 4 protein [Lachnospiraceae bacterium]